MYASMPTLCIDGYADMCERCARQTCKKFEPEEGLVILK